MEQQNSCYDRFGHTLGGGPPHRLTMKFDSESIGHGRNSEPLVAPSLGSQAGLASALDMDVIRPCHRNDGILRLNPIPKAQENLIRFRAENAGNHDLGPLRRLARSARSFLTKTHTPLEILWPEELVAPLRTYLDVHRPLSVAINRRGAKLAGDALWVSSRGSPLTELTIYNTIPCTHRKLSAKAINPHLFRDAAATTLAIADPAHVRVAAPQGKAGPTSARVT